MHELMEVELEGDDSAAETAERIVAASVPGLSIIEVQELANNQKARIRSLSFELSVPAPRRAEVGRRIAELLAQDSYLSQRDDGSQPVDVRPAIEELTLSNDRLRFRLLANTQGGARPRAVLEALGVDDLPAEGHLLTRTQVELET